nr:hypothetical protein [Rhodoferax sp.]
MKPHFAFKFANSSTALKDIHGVRFQHNPAHPGPQGGQGVGPRQGKPIHAFFTQGMQIVGVPPELVAILGCQAIASLNGGVNFGDVGKPVGSTKNANSADKDKGARLITSVHIETAQAIYLLRIENQVYMAMPQ